MKWFPVVCLIVLGWVFPVGAQTHPADSPVELTGAVIEEQGVTFAVVAVKDSVLADRTFADQTIQYLEPAFGKIPVVLMVQDAQGIPSYYGRDDIVAFLSKTPIESIPWKKYTLSPSL